MTGEKRNLLNNTHKEFFDVMLFNFAPEKLEDFVVSDVMGYGTTVDEKIFDLAGLQKLVAVQKEQAEGIDLNFHITPIHRSITADENVAIYVDEIVISMQLSEGRNEFGVRVSTILEYQKGKWKVIHWHGSKPVDIEEDTWHKDELKKRNEELQKQVEEKTTQLLNKNHELEIEAALERVRAEAMSIKKTDDLLNVCQIISQQLELLNISNIRNIQVVIIDESKKNYLNYQYFAAYSKKVFEVTKYENSPESQAMVSELQKSANSFYAGYIEGEALQNFRDWRKKYNQFPDPLLDKSPAAYYHFYSIGNGGLGLTTYKEISDENVDIFKRFHKVFELAYQRFKDIELAEAQTREAQVEAALERIRSQALGMHDSEDIGNVSDSFFTEFNKLTVKLLGCTIAVIDGAKDSMELWRVRSGIAVKPFDNLSFSTSMRILKKNLPALYPTFRKALREKKDFLMDEVTAEKHIQYINSIAEQGNYSKEEKDRLFNTIPENAVTYYIYFKRGYLALMSEQKLTDENLAIAHRFLEVFDFAHTRFLDIKRAEAQTREAQIETALERIRSRSMAMHKSEELADLSLELVKQVQALGVETWFCAFNIYDDSPEGSLEWGSNGQGTFPKYRTPHEGIFLRYIKAGQKGETLLINEIDEKECPAHYEYLCSLPGVGEQLLAMKDAGIQFPTSQIDHVAYFKYGYIIFITFEPVPTAHNIFKRFAKVFEQTYTRFLDLQKAEAQARKAQIEASLEKVRGVALSLQKSDQMLQIAQVLYEQLLELGFNNIRNALIDIKNGNTDTFTDYDYSHEMSGTITQMSYHDDPTLEGQFKMMATTTNDFFELVLEGKELEDLKKMRISNGEAPDPRLDNTDLLTYNLYSFGNGAIGISNFGLLTEEEKTVLARFSNVFTFAYKRYNDMLQAENQAREALVELSLERIRAQVTAMQESTELLDIVVTMQTEFNKLGHEAHYFWHMRWLPDKYEKALTNAEGDRIGNVLELPRGFHGLKNMMDWEKSDEPSAVFALDPDTAADYIDKMIKLGRFQEIDHTAPGPDDVRDMGGLTFVMARTTHGEIGYTLPGEVPNPPEADIALLVRFAGVFDLAYRRFEDLKSAERQNRETQIDLALERVRAKTMAMQKSEELSEVVTNLFHQLDDLGIKTYRCNLGIINTKTKHCRLWSTTSEGKVIPSAPNIPFTENKHLKKIYNDWKKQGAPVVDIIRGKNRLEWTQYIRKFIDFEEYKPEKLNEKKILSEPAILNQVFFKQGFFIIHTVEEMKDEYLDIVQRFARVFEQTYTRFLDLQRAEAQAREAIKQASLDRIRGQIASMRTSEDLNQLTPLVWRELKTLEVPFFRCGIFIVDEKKKYVNVYLTTPDGKPLGALNLGFEVNDLARATVASWKKKVVYQTHWTREEFIAWTQEMMKLGQVKAPEKYQGAEDPPESLHLHFIPFAQGMLYVGHEDQLEKEKIDLVKSLAKAFSFAYARYEDFVVLEEAKKHVEKALSDLKATQSQLVHAEKMASLGELTAGIAHEIQNPLNFVNNFSEVNAELIAELKEEIEKGDKKEAMAIADDIAGNEEKISHHGKRADGIVKGMLQHSRTSTDKKEPTDINVLADEYLRLSYHGLRAKDKSFNANFKLELDESLPKISVIPQDIGRVLLNLFNNAFYACVERSRNPDIEKSGKENKNYKPVVTLMTSANENNVIISVKDNGGGIPPDIKEKIFQPFFTTKPTGKGTGLGLSMSYDIITKGHSGKLEVDTIEGEGTTFIINIPLKS